MSFIRIKKRSYGASGEAAYAYLVENRWSKAKARQRVKQYLGRVYSSDKQPVDFFSYLGITDLDSYMSKDFLAVLADLVSWELHQHRHDEVTVNVSECRVAHDGRCIVVKMNDGYLCDFTMQQIIKAHKTLLEDVPGNELATAFVNAGIAIPKELFVELYSKLHR